MKKLFDPNISHELLAEFDNEVDKLELLRSLAQHLFDSRFGSEPPRVAPSKARIESF